MPAPDLPMRERTREQFARGDVERIDCGTCRGWTAWLHIEAPETWAGSYIKNSNHERGCSQESPVHVLNRIEAKEDDR